MELSMSGRPVSRWLFGKLPSQGDFVSRGIDHAFRDQLDAWLSVQMETAQSAFDDFNDRYMAAPACNFVDRDPEGLWSGGALCASVDRVGRQFPIILAAPARDAEEATAVSGACLAALHEAFEHGWEASDLHEAELVPAELPWAPDSPAWALLGEEGPAHVEADRYPTGIVAAMLEMAG
ncbi:hypothetical protein GCM10011371_19680 [Novosphingobium marinum]|nr:hypothetical protein GCM10011371_19680 [Novosphingobium marinum]